MSRFLFVVPPLAGHILPAVAVGCELADRGHVIAWAGHPETLGPLLPTGARLFPVVSSFGGQTLDQLRSRSSGLRGAAAFRFLWTDFLIPLATSMLPGVTAAVAELTPDVLVVDQQALAGGLVAHHRGLPWATSATTSAELSDQFATTPRLGEWAQRCLRAWQRDMGVSDPVDLRFSGHLVLVYSTDALLRSRDDLPGHYVFVGPATGSRGGGGQFPWDWLDPDRRHILVSLGTLNQGIGRRFFATTVAALEPLGDRLQAILVAPPGMVDSLSGHMLVRASVPQLDLLPFMDAVISHAGHNTVCEALSHGVPLVVAPIRDDQPVIAGQVVTAGAGIRVHFGRVGTGELRDAVLTVLDDPGYRLAAQRVQTSFRAAGGAIAAAEHLEKLA